MKKTPKQIATSNLAQERELLERIKANKERNDASLLEAERHLDVLREKAGAIARAEQEATGRISTLIDTIKALEED